MIPYLLLTICFLIGFACSFGVNILIFCLIALGVTLLAALAGLVVDLGVGIGLAALTAAVVTQLGFGAGVFVRGVLLPFFESRANERGAAAFVSSGGVEGK